MKTAFVFFMAFVWSSGAWATTSGVRVCAISLFPFGEEGARQDHGYDADCPMSPDGLLADGITGNDSATVFGIPEFSYYYAKASLYNGTLQALSSTTRADYYNSPATGLVLTYLQDTVSFDFREADETASGVELAIDIDGYFQPFSGGGNGNHGSLGVSVVYQPLEAGDEEVDLFQYSTPIYYRSVWQYGSLLYTTNALQPLSNGKFGVVLPKISDVSVYQVGVHLSVQSEGSLVDFSHTARLSLGLPDNVSYISASGSFLGGNEPTVIIRQLSPSGNTVPEPSLWTAMVIGFGVIGVGGRSRIGRLATRS